MDLTTLVDGLSRGTTAAIAAQLAALTLVIHGLLSAPAQAHTGLSMPTPDATGGPVTALYPTDETPP